MPLIIHIKTSIGDIIPHIQGKREADKNRDAVFLQHPSTKSALYVRLQLYIGKKRAKIGRDVLALGHPVIPVVVSLFC